MRFCRRGFKLKQDLQQDARIFRMRVLERSTARLFGRRALPRLDARKKRAGENPRAPAEQVRIRRSPPTEAALHPLCRWRSPDRHRSKNGHSCTTETFVVREHPLPNRSRSGDLDLRTIDGDRRRQPPVDGDRQIASGTGSGDAAFTSPASPPQTSSTHDAQATQAPATDASPTSHAYHQTKLPQFDNNAQPQVSPTYR